MKRKYVRLITGIFLTVLFLFAPEARLAGAEIEVLSFQNEKLSNVLQVLTRKTGIRLITSSSLSEKTISAYLQNVSGDDAIDSILGANGLVREKMEGTDIYIVKEPPPATIQEPAPAAPLILVNRTFYLQYAKAGDLGEALISLLSPEGKIISDNRTGSITAIDTENRVALIAETIASLDKSMPQVSIEAVLVELTEDGLRELGTTWDIRGRFFTPSVTEDSDFSFKLGNISFANLEANLRILQTRGKAQILANPRITTLNDVEAEIKITKNMAIAPIITETEEGRRTVTEYEYRDVGVTLTVTPKINDEGYITLTVAPSVSSAIPSSVFPDAVDTHERTARTQVMIRDGDTLVIGGLLRKDSVENRRKVPIIGDILPFLFSSSEMRSEETDLVIFLTPRIMDQKRAKSEAEDERERMLEAPAYK